MSTPEVRNATPARPVLPDGTRVRIVNPDHMFYGKLGTVLRTIDEISRYQVQLSVFAHLDRPASGIHSLGLLINIAVAASEIEELP